MKTHQQEIAEILAHAPLSPPLVRTPERKFSGFSEETKAHLIAVHAAYATYGHPPADSYLM